METKKYEEKNSTRIYNEVFDLWKKDLAEEIISSQEVKPATLCGFLINQIRVYCVKSPEVVLSYLAPNATLIGNIDQINKLEEMAGLKE